METNNKDFDALMQRVLEGSDHAATELFRQCEPYLLHVIRRRLSKRLRSAFDSMDLAQDVWKSFFAANPQERKFATAKELVGFLAKLARHKVIDVVKQRFDTQRRDMDREVSLDDSRRLDKDRIAGPDRTPSQLLMSREEWTEFLRKQPLVYRQIFVLLREGRSTLEIANELQIAQRTVQRVIDRYLVRTAS